MAGERFQDRRQTEPDRFYFSRKIEAGHLLQVVVMVVISVAFALGAYYAVIARLADHDSKLLVHDQKFVADEASISRIDDISRAFQAEMRGKLDHTIEIIGDIKDRLPRQGGK